MLLLPLPRRSPRLECVHAGWRIEQQEQQLADRQQQVSVRQNRARYEQSCAPSANVAAEPANDSGLQQGGELICGSATALSKEEEHAFQIFMVAGDEFEGLDENPVIGNMVGPSASASSASPLMFQSGPLPSLVYFYITLDVGSKYDIKKTKNRPPAAHSIFGCW